MIVLEVIQIVIIIYQRGQKKSAYYFEYGTKHDEKYSFAKELFWSLISLAINVYITICIHSLYEKFEQENLPQTMPPMMLTLSDDYAQDHTEPRSLRMLAKE